MFKVDVDKLRKRIVAVLTGFVKKKKHLNMLRNGRRR